MRLLLVLLCLASLPGCIWPGHPTHTVETGGTFRVDDGGVSNYASLDAGEYVEWTWSSDAPVRFDVEESTLRNGTETWLLQRSVNGTANEGRFTATRSSTIYFGWEAGDAPANVTYHLKTDGSLRLFSF